MKVSAAEMNKVIVIRMRDSCSHDAEVSFEFHFRVMNGRNGEINGYSISMCGLTIAVVVLTSLTSYLNFREDLIYFAV